MKIWITGGAGFLGRRLAGYLGKDNFIVSLSRRPNESVNKSVIIDLAREYDRLSELLKEDQPDIVIHAASRQPGPYALSDFVAANVLTTMNLIDALPAAPPRLVIFTSTQSVYSPSADLPFAEDRPASSSSPYAATKRWAEELMETYRESQVITLRLPSLFGAGQGDSFIDGLAKLALQNNTIELFCKGERIRDALHVDDVSKAISDCLTLNLPSKYVLVNLGCGRAISTKEYAEALVEAMDSKSEIILSERTAPNFDCYADISFARELIGFHPVDLRESMRRYAKELRA